MSEDKKSPTTPKQPEPKAEQPAETMAKKEGQGDQPNNNADQSASQPTKPAAESKASPGPETNKLNQDKSAKAAKSAPAEKPEPEKQAEADTKTDPVKKTEAPEEPTAPGAAKTGPRSGNGGGTKPPADQQQSSSGWWGALLVIVLVFIFLGGLAGAGWWANEQLQQFQQEIEQSQADRETERQAEWEAERQALLDNMQSVEQRLTQREEDVADLLADIEQTRDDLIRLARQVNEQATLQDSDIQRLEIEYLLRTARHITLLTGDLRQAESLLRQADQMLAEFDDLAYLPVREALSQDIQRLREVPVPDVDGIYFELQALAERAMTWQWWPETVDLSQPHQPEPAPADTWYEQAWQEVKDLVTVRYRDDANQTRLAPQEFNQLQAQFRLLMNQAQVALMQGNQTLYDTSIEQAISWLETGAGQVPQANVVIQQLQNLLDQTVTIERPEINRGLNRLQQMIRSETEEVS